MKKEKQLAVVRRKRKRSIEDWIVDILAYGIAIILILSIILPFMQVITISVSPASVVNKTGFHLIPTKFDFSGYTQIASDDNFWHSYLVTIIRAIAGTASGVLVTLLTAYPLAKTNLPYRKGLMMFIVFTMYFSGGMIPEISADQEFASDQQFSGIYFTLPDYRVCSYYYTKLFYEPSSRIGRISQD